MARSANGGIGGSGIFGGIGSVVQCDAQDKSLFCQFSKLMNIIVWLMMLTFIFIFIKSYLFKK